MIYKEKGTRGVARGEVCVECFDLDLRKVALGRKSNRLWRLVAREVLVLVCAICGLMQSGSFACAGTVRSTGTRRRPRISKG